MTVSTKFTLDQTNCLAMWAGENNLPVELCLQLADDLATANFEFDRDDFLNKIEFNLSKAWFSRNEPFKPTELEEMNKLLTSGTISWPTGEI